MRRVFETTTVIAAPRAEVWAVLTDWRLAPAWIDGVDELTADGPVEPGTLLTFSTGGRGRVSAIVDAEPGTVLRIRSQLRGVTADYAYELSDDPAGTRVRLVATCSVSGPQRLLGPVLREAMRRTDSGQLEALQAVVEGG